MDSVNLKRPFAEIEENLQCAICMQTMQDPQRVRVADCFHAYCKQCILAWTASHRHCPQCRREFTAAMLEPDRTLEPICALVRRVAQEALQPAAAADADVAPVAVAPAVVAAAPIPYEVCNFNAARKLVAAAQRDCVVQAIVVMGWDNYRTEIFANLDKHPEEFYLLRQGGQNKGFCQVSTGDTSFYADEGYISWVGSLDMASHEEVSEKIVCQTLPMLKHQYRRAYLYLKADSEPFARVLRKIAADMDMVLREEPLGHKFKFTFELHKKQSTYVPDFLELRLDSFMMPENHPAKAILDLLFEDGAGLQKAGFLEGPRGFNDPDFDATHEALPGYVFKGLLREASNRSVDLNLHRVTMGEQLRAFFRVNGFNTFVVPEQWLYHIPGRPRALTDTNYLVVIKWPENLVSEADNGKRWKEMSQQTVNQLYMAIRENRFMDAWPGTVKFDTTGRLWWTSTMPVKTLDILRKAKGADRRSVDVELAHEIKSTGIIRSLVGNWGEGSYLSEANQRFIRTKL